MLRARRETAFEARARVYTWLALSGLGSFGCTAQSEVWSSQPSALAPYTDARAWSRKPPGLEPVDVPQFVAVTFDDNFVSGLGDVKGGMTWATSFFESLKNPAGSGYAPSFDGAPVRTTFYDNCVYLQDESTRKSWLTARQDGHEIANHTVNHPNGGAFTAQAWTDEIAPCTALLTAPEGGVGITADDVRGFRAPYLAYSPALFGVLKQQGLWYDTSLQSCWHDADDGKSCAWPYTLDQGSPDSVDLSAKFGTPSVPETSGLWELTPSALFIPPDELSTRYGFEPGLRDRVPSDMPAPSYYEAATGRIAPLDVTLFVDAGLSPAEVLATLKYTLDLRLSGNRAPLVFVSHSHVYASNYGAAPKAPDVAERQRALEDFVQYALDQPVVRMRPVADILTWLRDPKPLSGVVTFVPPAAGAGSGAAAGVGAGGSANEVAGFGGRAGGGGSPATAGQAGGSLAAAGQAGAAPASPSPSCQLQAGVGRALRRPSQTASSCWPLFWLLVALTASRKTRYFRGRRAALRKHAGGYTAP